MAAGLLLIAAALFLTAYHIWDGRRAEHRAKEVVRQLGELTPGPQIGGFDREALKTQADAPTDDPEPKRALSAVEVDGNEYIGILEIPDLGLTLPVMKEWSDAKLRLAPCRYGGSAYLDDFIIAAHNYPQHFGNLNSLEAGDRILFTDVQGNAFSYVVAWTELLDGGAVEEMDRGDWDLTLFTCTLGGKRRVTVRCERTGEGRE